MVKAKPTLGNIVRHIRNSNGWTLAEMSQHVAIPLSTLAKVEKGHLTLTYDKLLDLSDKLGMSLSDFLNASPSPTPAKGMARRSVGKGTTNVLTVETKNYDYRYLCTELRGKIMIPLLSRARAKTMEEFGELLRHPGEEFVFVLTGAIEVHSEFYDPITLHAGEYIYLDSEMAHGYIVTDGFEEATVLAVCASAAANLQQELISHARAEAPDSDPEQPKVAKLPVQKKTSAKGKRRAGVA
ncbi:helix-turn-helix domain-containing protein [Steroidobacter sp.]|uniref:helix-turn-helix domain-containing protein n=1 Tax=Steroidobacter sp. TaxID=1978227 RepID=UPI001A63C61C|nr:XRE family transcriptional regulator [Steroidobacter sp.]MBL8266269.1 helix-turn-helix transcriptional regulator [Steroidobacter sp.]